MTDTLTLTLLDREVVLAKCTRRNSWWLNGPVSLRQDSDNAWIMFFEGLSCTGQGCSPKCAADDLDPKLRQLREWLR